MYFRVNLSSFPYFEQDTFGLLDPSDISADLRTSKLKPDFMLLLPFRIFL